MSARPNHKPNENDSAVDEPIPCPACGYDLRGIAAPACPECGSILTPDTLALQRRKVRYGLHGAKWFKINLVLAITLVLFTSYIHADDWDLSTAERLVSSILFVAFVTLAGLIVARCARAFPRSALYTLWLKTCPLLLLGWFTDDVVQVAAFILTGAESPNSLAIIIGFLAPVPFLVAWSIVFSREQRRAGLTSGGPLYTAFAMIAILALTAALFWPLLLVFASMRNF